eukprot:NODE_273_length_1038_cov_470.664105_g266_i0.p1 GENE.NODE_273_length_1038_cov_470.664105_g266_i0~~NODE_273_length_1038_cov_470.664105_g266_i0.p1  ORF type:complete len:250 (-),score=55.29 NODE_273_length_1038_cov_470.664105_g266_i0:124-873(-)
MDTEDYKCMKVAQLKDLCRSKGLKVTGTKPELISRLTNPLTAVTQTSRRTALSVQAVNKMLQDLGVKNPDKCSKCLRAGIQRRHINMNDGLDSVVAHVRCENCDVNWKVTVNDVLYQPECGHDYEDGSEAATATCPNDCKWYITQMCSGNPQADSGKFHNHCTECPGFGKCMGDYREAHCFDCGKHFFCGLSGFGCPNCERKRDRAGLFGGPAKKRGKSAPFDLLFPFAFGFGGVGDSDEDGSDSDGSF